MPAPIPDQQLPTPDQLAAIPKPELQKKPLGDRAKDLLKRFTPWVSKSDPDKALQAIAAPIENQDQQIQKNRLAGIANQAIQKTHKVKESIVETGRHYQAKSGELFQEKIRKPQIGKQFEIAGFQNPAKAVAVVEWLESTSFGGGFKIGPDKRPIIIGKKYQYKSEDIEWVRKLTEGVDDPVQLLTGISRLIELQGGSDERANVEKFCKYFESIKTGPHFPDLIKKLSSMGVYNKPLLNTVTLSQEYNIIGQILNLSDEEYEKLFSSENIEKLRTFGESVSTKLPEKERRQPLFKLEFIPQLLRITYDKVKMDMYKESFYSETYSFSERRRINEILFEGAEQLEALVTEVPELIDLYQEGFNLYDWIRYRSGDSEAKVSWAKKAQSYMQDLLRDEKICANAKLLARYGLTMDLRVTSNSNRDFARTADPELLEKALLVWDIGGEALGFYGENTTGYHNLSNLGANVWGVAASLEDFSLEGLAEAMSIFRDERFKEQKIEKFPLVSLISGTKTTDEIKQRIETAFDKNIQAALADEVFRSNISSSFFMAGIYGNTETFIDILTNPQDFLYLYSHREEFYQKLDLLKGGDRYIIVNLDLQANKEILTLPDTEIARMADLFTPPDGPRYSIPANKENFQRARLVLAFSQKQQELIMTRLKEIGISYYSMLDDKLTPEAMTVLASLSEKEMSLFKKDIHLLRLAGYTIKQDHFSNDIVFLHRLIKEPLLLDRLQRFSQWANPKRETIFSSRKSRDSYVSEQRIIVFRDFLQSQKDNKEFDINNYFSAEGIPTMEFYKIFARNNCLDFIYNKGVPHLSLSLAEKEELFSTALSAIDSLEPSDSPDRTRLFAVLTALFDEETSLNRSIPRSITDPLLKYIRKGDDVLPLEAKTNIPEETFANYNQGVLQFSEAIKPSGKLAFLRQELLSDFALNYLARQPERIKELISLPTTVPKIFEYMETGPLNNIRGKVLEYIFGNGDIIGRARVFESIFSRRLPYWVQLFIFTDSTIGADLSNATSNYPIYEIPKIKIPLGEPSAFLTNDFGQREINLSRYYEIFPKKIAAMTVREKRGLLREELVGLSDGEVAAMTEVPFSQLKGIIKKNVWLGRIRNSIENSRDVTEKAFADTRNRQSAALQLSFQTGDYIHGAPLLDSGGNVLDYMLVSGNLPGEALGAASRVDSYPFNVDFSVMTPTYLETHQSIRAAVTESLSKDYGSRGDLAINGQLWFVYHRTDQSYDSGVINLAQSETHTLMLGGIPSTEISAIILNQPSSQTNLQETVLDNVIRTTIENGFYIPIYDLDGKLLFSTEDYDRQFEEQNMKVPVEIVDYAQKIDEQLGSNPGGVYLIPEEAGLKKHYVKYAIKAPEGDANEAQNRIWNEYLADRIYQEMGIATPHTEIIKIRELGLYAHSSEWLTGEQDSAISRTGNYSQGAVIDWLLANWDVQHDQNLTSINGTVYRMDSGGALLYRARGERKVGFGSMVTEMDSMKGAYPVLEEQDIKEQIEKMRKILTDGRIDQLVDSTRIKREDREYLKKTLKERRDYLYNYFENSNSLAGEIVTSEKGAEIAQQIERIDSFREVLKTEIPEFAQTLGAEGYQHNGVLLGKHIEDAIKSLTSFPEFKELTQEERTLAAIATLFHDIGKPTGAQGKEVPRDFDHEIPSANIALSYMKRWGSSNSEIQMVMKIILNDGIVSDIAREKVRDPNHQYSPEQFAQIIGDKRILKILCLVNRADVIATVGEEGYSLIEKKYNDFFAEADKAYVSNVLLS